MAFWTIRYYLLSDPAGVPPRNSGLIEAATREEAEEILRKDFRENGIELACIVDEGAR